MIFTAALRARRDHGQFDDDRVAIRTHHRGMMDQAAMEKPAARPARVIIR
jgi:hypothetical protein